LVAYGLVSFREEFGLGFVMWLMGIVIVSDTAGYFFGRILGGPKFWPSLSPKKTWSGTIAGWIGAVVLGALIWLSGRGDATLLWVSPLVCFAGQMGDIAESWLKRRAGVKDSSNLIPGHGGFMDRFDAVTGAVLAAMLIGLLNSLPAVT
ncbi:phosphatidate cytidylyltransferase, partial [Paracoccus sp. (in: a-proteobacteria)]|nr:phosphatidate cytidylyltransferase [Paracoccus sp. (in: a-proteobacteria)]